MKALLVISSILALSCIVQAQELGGVDLQDYLSTATHPRCQNANDQFITGFPNDSIWVNILTGLVIEGNFSARWTAREGKELLVETGYHPTKFEMRLKLSTGLSPLSHLVRIDEWIELDDTTPWNNLFDHNCQGDTLQYSRHYITQLDFEQDFGIRPFDIVEGVIIRVLGTPGAPDLAGVYITDQASSVNSSDQDFSLCPNPTNDILNIKIPARFLMREIKIFASDGKLVTGLIAEDILNIINVTNYPQGVYLVAIGSLYQRFVKLN